MTDSENITITNARASAADEATSERDGTDPSLGLHRRTWELELLLSGAIIVALFKFPGAVDEIFNQVRLHISSELFTPLFYIYYPAKMALTPMMLILMLHILIRGFWVGLVGLNAVFPGGIKWDKIDVGPLTRSLYESRLSTRRLQERADQLSSALFSVLFIILTFAVAVGLWALLSIAIALFIKSILGSGLDIEVLAERSYFAVFLIIVAPPSIVNLVDLLAKKAPGLIDRWPRLARIARGTLLTYYYGFFLFLWYPPIAVLVSNLSRRRLRWWEAGLASIPASMLLALTVVLPLFGPRLASLNSYVYAPPLAQESGQSAVHYDSLRPADAPVAAPSIQSDMLRDPYLRLFLPYDAYHDNNRLAEFCPEVEPFRADGDLLAAFLSRPTAPDARAAALGCFSRLWTVELDGRQIADLELWFADQPGNGGRGAITYLAIDQLPPGRHLLVIRKATTARDREHSRHNPEHFEFYIPFWL